MVLTPGHNLVSIKSFISWNSNLCLWTYCSFLLRCLIYLHHWDQLYGKNSFNNSQDWLIKCVIELNYPHQHQTL